MPHCTSDTVSVERRSRILRRLDTIRYACADSALDELASCDRVLRPIFEQWEESDRKYEAIADIISFIATADESFTHWRAMDDDGTRTDVGWRNLLINPLRSAARADTPAGSATPSVLDVVNAAPTDPERWRSFRNACVAEGTITQRNGRMDCHVNCGHSNDLWLQKLDVVRQAGRALRNATSYAQVQDAVFCVRHEADARGRRVKKYGGFSAVRSVWIVALLVRFLSQVRDETLREEVTPALEGWVQLVGRSRALCYHDHLGVNCEVIVSNTLRHLPARMRDALCRCS